MHALNIIGHPHMPTMSETLICWSCRDFFLQPSRCGLSHAPANSRQPARCIAFCGPERGGAVVSAPEDALGGALASLVEAPGRYKPPSLPTWSRFTRTEAVSYTHLRAH